MALLSCLSPFVSVAFSSLLSIQNFLCKQLLNRKAQISELCIGVTFVNIGLERLSWGNVKLKHEKEINRSFKILIFGLAVWCVVSQSGIQPVPLAVEVWSPNHWTTREFPGPWSWRGGVGSLNNFEEPPPGDRGYRAWGWRRATEALPGWDLRLPTASTHQAASAHTKPTL